MIIKEDLVFRDQLLKQIGEREFSERSGVHSSDLIYCLNKQALKKLDPQPNTDEEILKFSLGWSTQRWLTGEEDDEQGIEVDGIIVTPDKYLDGEPWELKATYQSSTKPIEENVHWVRQVMAQCYVTKCLRAKLSRLEIMGNWKWVYKPKTPEKIAETVAQFGENWMEHPTLKAWSLEFTQAELDAFWSWMRQRRDAYLSILETKKLLPKGVAVAKGQEFECGWCGRDCA